MRNRLRPAGASFWWRSLGRACMLTSATLASCVLAATPLAAEPPSFRSVKDVRPRIPDELDRPVRRETSSHRGWEIRADQFTIAANTSLDDARWAAAEVTKARGQMFALADRFTTVHRNPDFGLNSLQVVIDGNPPRDRDAPQVTINIVGIQTQAVINVSQGQPGLKDQLLRLREAASFAVLHAAELDSELPPWVIGGMAAHVARQVQAADAPQPNEFAPAGEPLGGQQWRGKRVTPDRLALPKIDRTAAASQVAFLLGGNDGEHAPELLAGLVETIAAQRTAAATTAVTRRRGEEQSVRSAAHQARLERLLASSRQQYEAWRKDPEAGQPVFAPESGTSPALEQAQREMIVVLKLQRRLASEGLGASIVKVATFDREKGKQLVGPAGDRPPIAPAAIAERLRDPSQPPMATLDAEGGLLLSTDRDRINRLFGWDGQRYQLQRHENQWLLSTRLADGRTLRGYLADNPDKPSRPLAKFSVEGATASGPKPKSDATRPEVRSADAAAILPQ